MNNQDWSHRLIDPALVISIQKLAINIVIVRSTIKHNEKLKCIHQNINLSEKIRVY